jgi:type II secretory pathway component HofQ
VVVYRERLEAVSKLEEALKAREEALLEQEQALEDRNLALRDEEEELMYVGAQMRQASPFQRASAGSFW